MDGQDLTREQAAQTMDDIMSGNASAAQIGGVLTALRMKGETVEEIVGFVTTMREKSTRIDPIAKPLIDTCGTGGDLSGTFNISTAAAFVVSAAGIAVAKHGNRSVSSRCGSADVLEALGVRIDMAPEDVKRAIDDIGIGFMFAPIFHGAMKHAAAARRELSARTVFNLLGPMTNPASAQYQLLGVYDEKLTNVVAKVLAEMGTSTAMIVHGSDGLDEITITGETMVSEVSGGCIKNYTITPEQFGLSRADIKEIAGGDSEANADIIRNILGGERGHKRNIVVLNAGAAIYVGGKAESMAEGIKLAQELLDNGSAAAKLNRMISYTNAI